MQFLSVVKEKFAPCSRLEFNVVDSVNAAYSKQRSGNVCFLQMLSLYRCQGCYSMQKEFSLSFRETRDVLDDCMTNPFSETKNCVFFAF